MSGQERSPAEASPAVSAFFAAVAEGRADDVRDMVETGQVLLRETRTPEGLNAYHMAAMSPAPAVLAFLLTQPERGLLHEFVTLGNAAEGEMTVDALRLSLRHNNKETAGLLISHGAAVNGSDPDGQTPLHFLLLHRLREGDGLELLQLLGQSGADLDRVANNRMETPLYLAVKAKNVAAVEFLLKHGCDPDSHNHQGMTPLHYGGGSPPSATAAIFRLLIASGANVNAQDKTGNTPLHNAAHFNKPEVVKILLAAGADPLIANLHRQTPDMVCQSPVQKYVHGLIIEARLKAQEEHKARGGRFARPKTHFKNFPK